MQDRKIITTHDGSASIYVAELNEHYHSIHGAIQESAHVFLKMGLEPFLERTEPIEILEIGLGTGLNTLMTLAAEHEGEIHYTTVEKYPIEAELWQALEYPEALQRPDLAGSFEKIHTLPWEQWECLSPTFQLCKLNDAIETFEPGQTFDIVYFDAFAPQKQPELWTEEIFAKMYRLMNPGGVLVTYCAKGSVRRAMIAVGFRVEKMPGPPGKREMLRAWKE